MLLRPRPGAGDVKGKTIVRPSVKLLSGAPFASLKAQNGTLETGSRANLVERLLAIGNSDQTLRLVIYLTFPYLYILRLRIFGEAAPPRSTPISFADRTGLEAVLAGALKGTQVGGWGARHDACPRRLMMLAAAPVLLPCLLGAWRSKAPCF